MKHKVYAKELPLKVMYRDCDREEWHKGLLVAILDSEVKEKPYIIARSEDFDSESYMGFRQIIIL